MHETNMTYKTIRIPEPIINEIEKLIKTKYRGYRSKAEFITTAIREKLDQIKKEGINE